MAGGSNFHSLGARLRRECSLLREYLHQAVVYEAQEAANAVGTAPEPPQDILRWKWSLDMVLARILRLIPTELAFLRVKRKLAETLGHTRPTAAQLRELIQELEIVARILNGRQPPI